jgi:hypothetical protein
MSAPALRTVLAGHLAALDAQLAPAPVRVRQFEQPEPPEDATVTISLRTAQQALMALRDHVRVLEAAAAASHGHSEDIATAYYRARAARLALDELLPAETAATAENGRRRAEWRARTRG